LSKRSSVTVAVTSFVDISVLRTPEQAGIFSKI
jgi:hypothetical protein